jgi:isoquinoline 1-oxidoreductase subunit beta
MGVKRRIFLIGGAAVVGGGIFALRWQHGAMQDRAKALTGQAGEATFTGWLKISTTDEITLYSPSVDMGQGTHSALAQMLAEELDADFSKLRVEQAPADPAFADAFIIESGARGTVAIPQAIASGLKPLFSFVARQMDFQQTSGSNAIIGTGQFGMRVIGASVRQALVATAAKRLSVAPDELTTENSLVLHRKSSRTLRFGELALEAAASSLDGNPKLKDRKDFKVIGTSVARADIPDKVTGKAIYGSDFHLPDMRIATIRAAPVRGGKLVSVDDAPALAIKGVEKVIRLENAVAVIGKGYWHADKGLQALQPKFDAGGNGAVSTASIHADQQKLHKTGKPDVIKEGENVTEAFASAGLKTINADYTVPYLHHMMMEPFAITAHFKDGRLDIWGGVQEPLAFQAKAIELSGLDAANVTFHPMMMGGAFGRRFVSSSQHIDQIIKIAMQLPYPVKLLWSREEDVTQGAYRPQVSATHKGAVTANGRIAAWSMDYAQPGEGWSLPDLMVYDIPAVEQRFFAHSSHLKTHVWRAVDFTQHGFFVESFVDELAHAAGADPVSFRLAHLSTKPDHRRVLQAVAERAGWTSALPEGVGRGVAIAGMGSTLVAMVVEASMDDNSVPKVHRVVTCVDCGIAVDPRNAEAQVEGGLLMGLSAALQEKITIENGAVVQRNFTDYAILQMAQAPKLETHFLHSDRPIGGLGEMAVSPVAPALANALFAATGQRLRALPFITQA